MRGTMLDGGDVTDVHTLEINKSNYRRIGMMTKMFFLRERADYGTHFDFDTTSGKTDGKLLTGMKNHFDTAEFSS